MKGCSLLLTSATWLLFFWRVPADFRQAVKCWPERYTLLFPSSYNVYDSYGEALIKNGYRQEVISMYRKALELNPENAESEEALRQILGN